MNALVCECLQYILSDPAAWETMREKKLVTGHKPKMSYIRHELINAREARFYDEVYFPHMQRLMEIVKRRDLFKGATWELRELGYSQKIMVWVPNEEEFQSVTGDHMQFYMEPIWDNEQWAYEYWHVTDQDVLSLGIRPAGMEAVQPMLFGMAADVTRPRTA